MSETKSEETAGILEQVFVRVTGMILKPAKNFLLAANDSVTFTVLYVLILIGVFGLLYSIYLSRFVLFMMSTAFMLIIAWMLVQMIVSFLLNTVWLHLWVYAFGGRKGLKNTLRIVAYSMTPMLLIGWLMPVGMIIAVPWSFILEILGIRELHEVSTTRAILAAILPVVVMLGILIGYLMLTDPKGFAQLVATLSGTGRAGSPSVYSY
ncbi:MAG: Yip1 family protein [Methanoregulaceae archaeon]